MLRHSSIPQLRWNSSSNGLPEIVGGMSLVVATIWQPALPPATGMALVMLGATRLAVQRFQRSEGFIPLLLLNTAIYGALVALCVGARLDLITRSEPASPALILADLALSFWPAAAALVLVSRSVVSQPSAD